MRICHLTTTHRPDDARITRESQVLSKDGHRCVIVCLRQPYPKWQHLFQLLSLIQPPAGGADVYHCHEPDALVIGLIHKLLRGAKVVYDVHEHWPSELPRDLGLPQWLSYIIDPIERWLARRADAIVTVSESVGSRFDDPIILPNYPMPGPGPQSHAHTSHRIALLGAKLQSFHAVAEAVEAVQVLREEYPDLTLVLIGTVAVDLPPDAPVECTGYLPQDEIPGVLAGCSIGLALLNPEYENIRIGLPNRLFTYMAAGIPVVATDLPEIGDLVVDVGCGMLVDPGDQDELVAALRFLLKNPHVGAMKGQTGQAAVHFKYNWRVVENRLKDLYNSLGNCFKAF